MDNKADYLARLQVAVSKLHNCDAVWRETVTVHEAFHGKTVWKGDVEVFDLPNHPKAERAYAWNHCHGIRNDQERFVAVLAIPPVDSAQKAVQVQIVENMRGKK